VTKAAPRHGMGYHRRSVMSNTVVDRLRHQPSAAVSRITPPRKHEEIADALTREILSGRYRCGERLPSERDLALRFDANRGAVREAMKRLEQLGLARIRPGGARVAPLHEASLDVIGHMLAMGDVPDRDLMEQIFQV